MTFASARALIDPVAHEINVMLGENQGLIDDKQREHDKKIERDQEVLPHSVGDLLLQSLIVITHGIFSDSVWIPLKSVAESTVVNVVFREELQSHKAAKASIWSVTGRVKFPATAQQPSMPCRG
jgi:hypothetical protein